MQPANAGPRRPGDTAATLQGRIPSSGQPKRSKLAALVASVALPAFAQTAEFYVVQDTATKKCTIVDKKPTVATQTIVTSAGTVYKTRAEAETGMKTVKICAN